MQRVQISQTDPALFKAARKKAKLLGLPFSAYVRGLIEADLGRTEAPDRKLLVTKQIAEALAGLASMAETEGLTALACDLHRLRAKAELTLSRPPRD
jgi:hypothetical protein